MKKVGYRAPFAGAVEAVASTGGQLMPPVMGTAAFLMADLSGAGYLNVAKAALLPAILYYLALLVMIHFEAVKNDLGKLSPDMVPETKSVVSRLYYLVPIAVLILLLGMGRSVVFCANIATLSIVLLAMLKAETRFTFKSFIEALVASSRGALMVSACCACSGLIVGVLSLTGIGYKFINLITILAGDSLFLLMVYLMLTSFVLGMGIPTTPAYIVVATLGAPALIKAGAPQLVAHMFVFYYAILSFITPPVCVAAFAGAAIAESKAMETGFIALKLGIVAFIVPYMFVYQPALLGIGETPEIIWAAITAIIGVIGLSPLLLVLCIAIKLDSPGPVFFKQKRVGIHKQHFNILKFRTMRIDTPHDMPTHLLHDPDQYITRVGRFLRKTSLDELPQLWNIFVGDMAVIGPRPALWNQYDLLAERDKYGANDVRPGLTGWAQIHGRDELEIADKARLDGYYVEHLSFGLDVKCFFGTIRAVLDHDGVVEGGTGTLHHKK